MVVDNEEIAVLAVGYPEWLARFPRRGPIAHRATPAGVVAALRLSESPACQLDLFLESGALNMLQKMLQRDPDVKQVDGRVSVLFGNVYGVSQNILNWWFIAPPARHFQEGGQLLSKRWFSFGLCLFLVNSPDEIQDEPIMDDVENLPVGVLAQNNVNASVEPIWKGVRVRSHLEELVKPFLQV